MAAIAYNSSLQKQANRYGPPFILGAAWLMLFAPVYVDFAQTAWVREENGHALFIMAIILGVTWSRLMQGGFTPCSRREFGFGLAALFLGLGVYSIGRLGEVDLLLSASQPMLIASIILCMFGLSGVRRLWFPLLLSFYLIIWPGWALDATTAPLKQFVSATVSNMLFAFGLPVARAGAVISAGSYELLIADACAGLNSLIALTAVGAVYLYAVKHKSVKTNLAVVLMLVPIAIFANLIRVTILVLITYFLGYDVGQGFLHEGAGLVMFAMALIGVFAVDYVAAFFWEPAR
jgi:exosortase